jgi:hypothetical protein
MDGSAIQKVVAAKLGNRRTAGAAAPPYASARLNSKA